jgi:transposase
MDVMYPCCCGLDVHKKTVAACLITSTEGPEPVKEIRTFRTMTADLLALADWLQQAGCTHVAMEMSLSRLNHWLPRSQAHSEVVQGTAEFHHQITDAFFP